MGIKVSVKRPDQLDKTIKIFKRNCSAAGILRDYRAKNHYEKPTMVRRLAKKQRLKNLKKIQRERASQN
jgi:small subunit ribosomal protein S21